MDFDKTNFDKLAEFDIHGTFDDFYGLRMAVRSMRSYSHDAGMIIVRLRIELERVKKERDEQINGKLLWIKEHDKVIDQLALERSYVEWAAGNMVFLFGSNYDDWEQITADEIRKKAQEK